tara:strand:+ start:2299 stop:2586 length:288 start_codon:yes stop_codon:yes gene_type:complete
MNQNKNRFKVSLLVDVYYEDTQNVMENDKDEICAEIRESLLDMVEISDEQGLLELESGLKITGWHSVVSDPTTEFIDDLPQITETIIERADGIPK